MRTKPFSVGEPPVNKLYVFIRVRASLAGVYLLASMLIKLSSPTGHPGVADLAAVLLLASAAPPAGAREAARGRLRRAQG